ncbi:MAG: site-specific integrase [Clostridia bacterium]|nr:site-specific integrase [Clostridia bacterium]
MSRRGENIFKRKDGRWEARFIKGYDINGKAKYSSVYAHSYSEVSRRRSEAISMMYSGKVNPSTLTLTDWFERWMSTRKEYVKPSTYAVYRRYCSNHIYPFFSGLYISRLCEDNIISFLESRNGLSSSTLKSLFVFFKSGLEAAKKEMLVNNVWSGIKLPQRGKKEPVRVFSLSEQEDLERAVKESAEEYGIGVTICLYTGIRIGELCGLRWEDINFTASVLSVRRTVQRISTEAEGKKTGIIVQEPKSVHSIRDIPLPSFLAEKLYDYKIASKRQSGYIFGSHSEPVEPRAYQYYFTSLLKRTGIKHANFHATRHTFAARALETGMDIKTLSEILGHADCTVTMKQYAHSSDEQKRKSMETLAERVYSKAVSGHISGQTG